MSWIISTSEKIFLHSDELHLWRIDLNCAATSADRGEALAQAKRNDPKKNSNKIITRIILSKYLHCPPEQIEFHIGSHGKPSIHNSDLQFNVSDSGCYVLLGVTRNHPIGVDIERIDRNIDYLALSKRFFTTREYEAIVNSADQKTTFFRCWTQKEAFIKAVGLGLSYGLSNFDVAPNEDCLSVGDFQVRSIDIDEKNYCAAFATEGVIESVEYFEYPITDNR